jgi:hypothetical protein
MDMRSLRRLVFSRTTLAIVGVIVALLIIGAYHSQQKRVGTFADAASPAIGGAAQVMPASAPAPAFASAMPGRRQLQAASFQPASFQPASVPGATTRLIRTAQLEIQVTSIVRAMTLADSMAKLRDAIITDSRSNEAPDGPRDAQFTVRVPSTHFSETLIALRGLGQVRNEGIGTQDVTREYADLETRIAVKREAVTRLRALLTQRTGKLSDVLDVERELTRTVTELEQMEGEQRYYDAQLAVSSITVHVYERPPALRAAFTDPILDAARNAIQVFASSVAMLVFALTFLAPWIVVAGAGWWLLRRHPIWTRRA